MKVFDSIAEQECGTVFFFLLLMFTLTAILQGALTQNFDGEVMSEIDLFRDLCNTYKISRVNIA